jgi:hypothetical protein
VTDDLLHQMAHTLVAGLSRGSDVRTDDEELYR